MSEFYVTKEHWVRFPKVLIMNKKTPDGTIEQRYIQERTCKLVPVSYATSACNNCGAIIGHIIADVILNQTEGNYEVNYCPNCGAKVVEE